MSQKVYLNGEIVDNEQAMVRISNPSFLHGVGLFETLRSYSGTPFALDRHIARMRASAQKLNMPIDEQIDRVDEAVRSVLEANDLTKDARIRITITPPGRAEEEESATLLASAVATEGYPAEMYTQGMMVHVCDTYRQSSLDPLTGHKTTSYFSRLLALRDAQDRACGEALWFTPDNHLAEGSISNVFLVKNQVVETPPLDTPVLPGVTREIVLELSREAGYTTEETPLNINELLEADEVFITNSVMEVMPVTQIERREIRDRQVGPVTQRLREMYQERVRTVS
jgi:branched-subunit amino acid aminotransferase/4-amino-4-deoxychorismate lyase